jgi:hypothetical protein
VNWISVWEKLSALRVPDEEGRPFYFTPNGSYDVVVVEVFFPMFCHAIEDWHLENELMEQQET